MQEQELNYLKKFISIDNFRQKGLEYYNGNYGMDEIDIKILQQTISNLLDTLESYRIIEEEHRVLNGTLNAELTKLQRKE